MGRKVLGKGSFGCVVKPYVKGDDNIDYPEDSVSKIFTNKQFRDIEYDEITNYQHLIDPKGRSTVSVRGSNNILVSQENLSILSKCSLPDTQRVLPQIVMSDGGMDLQTFFSNGGKLSFIHWMKQILKVCKTMKRLSDINIVHQDIKPQNMLIDDNFNIRIIDFGIAMRFEDIYTRKNTGPLKYTPLKL